MTIRICGEQPAQGAARDAKLEPGGACRPARCLAPGGECDRDREIRPLAAARVQAGAAVRHADRGDFRRWSQGRRSEEHTSELQSLMRISYAVFCLKKKKNVDHNRTPHQSTPEGNTHADAH